MQFFDLISVVQKLDDVLRRRTVEAVNFALTSRNWLIGTWIVKFEENGEEPAESEVEKAQSKSGLIPGQILQTASAKFATASRNSATKAQPPPAQFVE